MRYIDGGNGKNKSKERMLGAFVGQKIMNQQNNISTPRGRRVFSRGILFFLFLILAVIALVLGLNMKRYMDRERKQDNIEKEITT